MTSRLSPLQRVAVLAFLAMCVEDLLQTAMVIYESRYALLAAGLCDVVGWIAGIICMGLSVEEIVRNGWRTRKAFVLLASVSVANLLGTGTAVWVLARLTHHSWTVL